MQMNEQYRLYLLNLLVEVMTDEINELMRYGISPLGVGTVRPLDKERQNAIRPLLEKLSDAVRESTVKMIKETVIPANEESTAEEWIKIMLEELKMRASTVGGAYAHELQGVNGMILEMENILAEKDVTDE